MPLVARKTILPKYELDNGRIAHVRMRKVEYDAVSSWNKESATDPNERFNATISKSTRRAGVRARYFLYSATIESGAIYTTLYLKIPIFLKENFTTPPSGSATVTIGSQAYNFVKAIAEDAD